jgi:hypothetical protein
MKVNNFKKNKPNDGQFVVWCWYPAGAIYVGDYSKGKVRLAMNYYKEEPNAKPPTHWIDSDEFWKEHF